MTPESPVEIPEITGMVASYLEEKDLSSCLRVSKGWRTTFLPHRWRVIRVGTKSSKYSSIPRDSPRYRFGPHPTDIYRYRHLIFDLSLYGDTAGLDKYHYSNVRKLTINYEYGAEDSEREVFLELTEMFPLLTHLSIQMVELTSPSWLALSVHPYITTLSLCNIEIKETDVAKFCTVCTRLTVLSMHTVDVGNRLIPDGAVFNSLGALDIKDDVLDTENKLDLILRCPNLQYLSWLDYTSLEDNVPPSLSPDCIQRGCWPHLQCVDISLPFQDTDVASLLEGIGDGCGKLAKLRLNGCFVGERGSMALRLHFATLVELCLVECPFVSSSTFRDVLCSCSRLEVLVAKSILARDIVTGGPWVCQRLRDLRICFVFGEAEQDLQQDIFERLSTFTRLERLEMYNLEHESQEAHRLEFRLANGLGQLASLKQMTEIGFGDLGTGAYIPQLGRKEVLWMLAHWKKLRCILGTLNREPKEDHSLKVALDILGIKVNLPSVTVVPPESGSEEDDEEQ
jgi:hypothetical protein